jgi:hypothetical protein
MTRLDLKAMTIEHLVDQFIKIALEQEDALLSNATEQFTPLFWKMEAVEEELKARQGDQRRALLPLYSHKNMQVRLKAAKATLALAPHAARQALIEIKASGWQPQAGEAGMSLRNLGRGIFKPT